MKMLALLAIILTLMYEISGESSDVSNLQTAHPVKNIISKDDLINYATNFPLLESTTNNLDQEENNKEKTKPRELNFPMKIPVPLSHNYKMLTSIVYPIPQTILDRLPKQFFHPIPMNSRKAHDDFLNHEIPLLLRKLQQYYATEELRRKRKDLKEKFRRYKKLMFLHDLSEDNFKTSENNLRSQYLMDKATVKSTFPFHVRSRSSENMKENNDVHGQIQNHSRKLLQLKDEDTEPPVESSTLNILPVEKQFPLKSSSSSTRKVKEESTTRITPKGPPKYELNSMQTTDSHFNPAGYVYGPYIPLMPAMYWPKEKGTTTESTSSYS